MKKVIIEDRNLLRRKRITFLEKKINKLKQELTKDRMLLYFELRKELEEEYIKGGCKYDKTVARRIYQSFAKIYL